MSETISKRIPTRILFGPGVWLSFWMFTIGFADLKWWEAILAVAVWPFYVGMSL